MIRMNRELRSDLETTSDSIDLADFTLSLSLFLSLAQHTTHTHFSRYEFGTERYKEEMVMT